MFVLLLIVTFTIATVASFVISRMFDRSLAGIIARLIPDELAVAWHRYVLLVFFAVALISYLRLRARERERIAKSSDPSPEPPSGAAMILNGLSL